MQPARTPRNIFIPIAKLLETCLFSLHFSLAIVSQLREATGHAPFWIATLDIDEVVSRFTTQIPPNSVYDVGDFATMYTRLKHDQLKSAILNLHDVVLTWLYTRYQRHDLLLDIERGSWCEQECIANPALSGRDALARLLNDVIDNTYVVTASAIHRQVVGIPMGGCASSLLASLYCTYCEYLHVLATSTPIRGMRYIDDIIMLRLATDQSVLSLINYGIDFGSTELGLAKANFVGLTITNDCAPATCIYDRRLDFTCDIIRLPHASSALASHTLPAVVCGKLCRAWALSSSRVAFAEQACIAVLHAAERNTPPNAIKKGFGLFLRRLLTDFFKDERLESIKVLCTLLASLSSDVRASHLRTFESMARARQQAQTASACVALSSSPSLLIPNSPLLSPPRLTTLSSPSIPNSPSPSPPCLIPATFCSPAIPTTPPCSSSVPNSYAPTDTTRPYTANCLAERHGIRNIGNTCYVSTCLQLAATIHQEIALLQPLRLCDDVIKARRGLSRNPFCPTQSLIRCLCSTSQAPLAANCATECFELFINRYGFTPYIALDYVQTCVCQCGLYNSTSSTFTMLHIPVPSSNDSLDLNTSVTSSLVDCCKVDLKCVCNSPDVVKQNCITGSGLFAVFSLKRARDDGTICSSSVFTPPTLIISGISFVLVGVGLFHPSSVHYTVLVFDQTWLHCNDAKVTCVPDIAQELHKFASNTTLWLYKRDASSDVLAPRTRSSRRKVLPTISNSISASS